jgi:flagellar hook-length control protein FliK
MTAITNTKLRPADQSVMSPAGQQAQQSPTPELAFSQALQSNLRFASAIGMPTVGSALQQHVDMVAKAQQDQPQQAAPAKRAAAPLGNLAPQKAASDNADDSPAPAQQNDKAPVAQDDNGPAPMARATKVAAKADDKAGPVRDTSAADDAAQQAEAVQQQATVQVMQVVVQQQVAAVVQTGPQQQTGPVEQQVDATAQNSGHTDNDPFAWLDQNHGDSIAKLQNQIASNADTGAEDAPVFDLGMAKAAVAQVKKAAGIKTQDAPSAADRQAQDLSSMLAGTGAKIAIKVDVNQNAQQAAPVAPVIDPLLAAQAATTTGNQSDALPSLASGAQSVTDGQAGPVVAQPQNAANSADSAAVTEQAAFAALVKDAAPVEAGESNQGPQLAQVGATSGTQSTQKASAPQAPQAPRPVRSPVEQQVLDQVSVQINKGVKDGVDTIKVALKPAELGRIEVKLEVANDGQVKATVTADNKDTLAMLQRDTDGLSKALSDAGLKADASSMTFNLRGDQQQQQMQQQNGGQGQGRGGRGRRLATGIDATSEASAAASAQRATLRRSGVDIQV